MHPRVKGVEVLPPYGLRLTFRDGSSGIVDGRRWLEGADGTVFAPLRDPAFFAQVYVDDEAGTIAWPNDVDLDPDTLYELAHRPEDDDVGNPW
jgi:Protein of unknown function (DUF2442)